MELPFGDTSSLRPGLGHDLSSRGLEGWSEGCPVMSNSLRPHRLYRPGDSPGQNTGVGSLSLLQGVLPTQGSNLGCLHCRQILYQLGHQGSRRILEWVACPFCRGSSRPRDWTRVSCIAGGFFTNCAMRVEWGETVCEIWMKSVG